LQFNVPPDVETLVNKRLSSGGYASVEDVFRRALEAQDAEESWTDEERRALASHVDEGFLQAERGELVGGAQARREIQALKDTWLRERSPKGSARIFSRLSLEPTASRSGPTLRTDNVDAADRVEQAIYDACALLGVPFLRRQFRRISGG
jgi:hypothetical protein